MVKETEGQGMPRKEKIQPYSCKEPLHLQRQKVLRPTSRRKNHMSVEKSPGTSAPRNENWVRRDPRRNGILFHPVPSFDRIGISIPSLRNRACLLAEDVTIPKGRDTESFSGPTQIGLPFVLLSPNAEPPLAFRRTRL